MRDRWYVPGLVLCLVLASCSIFLSLRMRDGASSAAGEYVRWRLLLGDVVFLPVLMIALGRYRLGRQFERREAALYEVEMGLRQKTHGLEQTIRERTAELREEIEERHRAELLNRGRNRVLEMLAKNESLHATVKVLVATVTEQRSVWSAALHQLDGDALLLRGAVGVPEMLMDHLHRIKSDFPRRSRGGCAAARPSLHDRRYEPAPYARGVNCWRRMGSVLSGRFRSLRRGAARSAS